MPGAGITSETEEVDLQIVARMVEELLAANASATARDLFVGLDRPPPVVVWSPIPDELPLETLRFLLAYWHGARKEALMPPVEAIDALALKPVLGSLMVLDVLEDSLDFRFRLFGTKVAEDARYDWTGGTVDQMRRTLKGPGPAFYLAVYRALVQRVEPVFTTSPAIAVFKNRSWARLLLPFGDACERRVQRILVGNYAIGTTVLNEADERLLAELRERLRAERRRH